MVSQRLAVAEPLERYGLVERLAIATAVWVVRAVRLSLGSLRRALRRAD
jgi:hypothetical protein